MKYLKQNTGNVVNILNAMHVYNVNKFIFSSTCATYDDHEEMPITEDTVQVVSVYNELLVCREAGYFLLYMTESGAPCIFKQYLHSL
jgi:UDP-glucose 4-epimerase